MHILLTDVLQCPRCGPGFGLVVLADQLRDRRVQQGALGCANCRTTYPVRKGEADLRRDPAATHSPPPPAAAPAEEAALQTAALLGVADGGGVLLLAGDGGAELAPAVAALVPQVEVVAASAAAAAASPSGAANGSARIIADASLPFRDRTLRGVALLDRGAAAWLDEALRVLLPGARLVLFAPSPRITAHLRARGAPILLDEGGVVVASAPPPG